MVKKFDLGKDPYTRAVTLMSLNNFEAASKAALDFLSEHIDFSLWMITRTLGDDWIVLQCNDHGYGVKPGDVFRWKDSYCSRMIKGEGPRIAPNANDIACYQKAEINEQVRIGSYIGIPLVFESGELFGTLCAIDPEPKDTDLTRHLPMIEAMARLLVTLAGVESNARSLQRQLDHLRDESMTDFLTNTLNRRGWDDEVKETEIGCQKYGSPACVFIVDLDELKEVNDTYGHSKGDKLIQRCAQTIRDTMRDDDALARLGGDEFGLLTNTASLESAERMRQRLYENFAERNVKASIGLAIRDPRKGLDEAIDAADQDMLAEKRGRKEKAAQYN